MTRRGADGRDLVAHLARFCGALRDAGVSVSLADEVVAAEALTLVDIGDRAEVRRALLATLRVRPFDRSAFDALFAALWRRGPAETPRPAAARGQRRQRRPRTVPGAPRAATAPAPTALEREVPEGGRAPAYSSAALLRRKPFEAWTERDLTQLDAVMRRLVRRLATRRSRRLVPARGRGVVDMRRSLRRMLATGGEPISLARRMRPVERPRLVLLCDTSGSMDPHTRFLLAFALSLRGLVKRLHVFAFNTALTRITPWLSRRELGRTLQRLATGVPDWSGGTRIGACLEEFAERHLPWIVDADTVVVVLSDGLDRGDPERLARAVARIRRAARTLIWLNPLMGDPRYAPTARGMAAALPHLDRLAPAHDLVSLERLIPLLTA